MQLTVAVRSLIVRAYEGLPTLARPVASDYQQIALYVPEAYLLGGRVARCDARSAPIFLHNQEGDYMPARPGAPSDGSEGEAGATPRGMPPSQGAPGDPVGPNTIARALAQGHVVAAPSVRGRTLQSTDGR